MQLSEIRNRLTAAVRKMGKSYGPEEMDMAIQLALNEADLSAYSSLTVTSQLTMSANVPEISVSTLTGFRPEKVIRAQLAFNDRGVWAAAASYAENDLVQGDGTPDSYYWVCTDANTSSSSNEPGTDGGGPYWERRLWKRGDVVEVIDFSALAHMLGDREVYRGYLPADFIFSTETDDAGKPRFGSFLTQLIFVVYPPPRIAYKIEFVQKSAVTDWNPGTEANVDIDMPLNVLLPLIFHGAAYYLDTTAKDAQTRLVSFRQHIKNIDGNTVPQGAGVGFKDRAAYMDHTDGIERWPGRW